MSENTQHTRRDALVTVLGLVATILVFVFVVLLPGRETCKQHKQDILAAENTIRGIPLRVAELEHLRAELQDRKDFLTDSDHMIPRSERLHDVIQQVAELARKAGLKGSRLEPVSTVKHRTYRTQAFRLKLTGRFVGVAQFLAGLEQQARIVDVQEFAASGKDRGPAGQISIDVLFAVYSQSGDFAEFTDSPDSDAADI